MVHREDMGRQGRHGKTAYGRRAGNDSTAQCKIQGMGGGSRGLFRVLTTTVYTPPGTNEHQQEGLVFWLWLCTRIVVPRTSITDILHREPVQVFNTLLVIHQPTLCALWIRPGNLDSLPTDEHICTGVITCGAVRRGRGVWGWWGGGGSTLPFTDCPSGGTSSSSKRGGRVDGGGESELEAGVGGDSLASQQVTSSSHPFSGMVPGTWTERSTLVMRNASQINPFSKGVKMTSMSSKLF